MKHCPCCEKDTEGGIWCGVCGKSYDPAKTREALGSISVNSFMGVESLSPQMEKFQETGDPAVFAKPGALDYDPSFKVR